MKSYLTHLECTYCHETDTSADELHGTCDELRQGPLCQVRPGLPRAVP